MCLRHFSVLSLIFCFLAFLGCSDDTDDKVTSADEPAVDNTTPASGTNDDSSLVLAPNFTLLNTEFKEVSLKDYQGKVVIVDFWATWCKPCEKEIPLFIELYNQYRSQGFEMIGISMDDERLKVIEPFVKNLGVNYTILLGEPELIDQYKVATMPSAFLINRKGRIVKVFEGAQGEKSTYEKELKKLL